MLRIEHLVVGPIETNCYILSNSNQAALLIDPGAEGPVIEQHLNKNKLAPVAIVNTHGHYDHTTANHYLQDKYDLPVYYPKDDQYLLPIQKKLFAVEDFKIKKFYQGSLQITGFELDIIPTPGHSKGSSCLLINDNLFSGDMLFAEGYLGRTDLWGGSATELQESLLELLKLPDQIKVYPGHGPFSDLAAEKKYYV